MKITTDNIGEWCFRYLEKDLDTTEYTFFESELKNNSVLANELANWRKTYIKKSDEVVDMGNFSGSLFRYKNQFLLLLAELLLITTATCLFVFTAKPISKDMVNKNGSSISKEKSNKSSDSTMYQKDVYLLKPASSLRNNTYGSKDTIADMSEQQTDQAQHIFIDTTHNQISDRDTLSKPETDVLIKTPVTIHNVASDSTKAKKKSKRFNKNGSHLVPINNDL